MMNVKDEAEVPMPSEWSTASGSVTVKLLDNNQEPFNISVAYEEACEEKPSAEGHTEGDDEIYSSGRKYFIIRDRYWNRHKRQFEYQKPAKPHKEPNEQKECVIFVRRDYADDMTSFTTVLLISGPVLRNALRNIFRGVGGFGLTRSASTEVGPWFLFWARPELELLAEHFQNINDEKSAFEILAALRFIESEYKEMISVLPSLLPHSITFEYLWALLPPDCLIVGKNILNYDSIWNVRGHFLQRTANGVHLEIRAEIIMWDGFRAGIVHQSLRIHSFDGIKLIQDLPYFPLKYHPHRQRILQQTQERSARVMEFWKPQFGHYEYRGTGITECYSGVQEYPFSGRVIINPMMMWRMEPSNKLLTPLNNMGDLSRMTMRVSISDLMTKEQQPEILEELLKEADEPLARTSSNSTVEDDDDYSDPPTSPRFRPVVHPPAGAYEYVYPPPGAYGHAHPNRPDTNYSMTMDEKEAAKDVELSERQMLLVSGLLHGYSLQDGTWGCFTVELLMDIIWNSTIFDSLVMETRLKDVIYRVVVAHSAGVSDFDDFVKGKGRGLIGLLYGPPGSGKTLTAEAIAETAKLPLYALSSGALGHEATEIHDKLSSILRLASHWNAVLLLDEADVLLAQRTVSDIKRNAIVSVFLQEIEYYEGILLLTTNQADVIDEAFQSEQIVILSTAQSMLTLQRCHEDRYNLRKQHNYSQYPGGHSKAARGWSFI